MNNPHSHQGIQEIIRRVINEVAGVPPEAIRADSAMTSDLGLESLDFVDLVYRLQVLLGIQLPQKSLLEHSAELLPQGMLYTAEHGLTEAGIYFLAHGLNRFDSTELRPGMKKFDILNATKVSHWANLCHAIFDGLPDRCPDCGGDRSELAGDGKVVCSSCGKSLRPASGDDAIRMGLSKIQERWHAESLAPATQPQ